MLFSLIIIFSSIVLACPVCTLIVAQSKGRDNFSWLLIALLFGPFGLLAAIGVSPLDIDEDRARRGRTSNKQICPYCDEAVSIDAVLCRFCHSDLSHLHDEVELVSDDAYA